MWKVATRLVKRGFYFRSRKHSPLKVCRARARVVNSQARSSSDHFQAGTIVKAPTVQRAFWTGKILSANIDEAVGLFSFQASDIKECS